MLPIQVFRQERERVLEGLQKRNFKEPELVDRIIAADKDRRQLQVENDTIADAAFGGRGCSIATASASMLTDIVRGIAPRDALAVANGIDAMLRGEAHTLPDSLEALRGVAPFPARHGCATMPWAALRDALTRETTTREVTTRDSSAE
jgi:SUF system NifU family Fe-S assembly protein